MSLKRLALGALALSLLAWPAGAQGRRGGTPGYFDFYVLALSWSPGFCALEGDRKEREQCEPGAGLGFVVHGLWPQFERGFPSECGMNRSPSRIAMQQAEGVFPSEGLARYQWRKHGTCSGSSPADYFADVRRARDKVAIPEALRHPRQPLRIAPLELERAFADANPGLRPDMISLACRRGMLQEVRICLTRDLRNFRTCPEVDRSGCRGGELQIDPPR